MNYIINNLKNKIKSLEVITVHLNNYGQHLDDMAKEDFLKKVSEYAVSSLHDVRNRVTDLQGENLKKFILN